MTTNQIQFVLLKKIKTKLNLTYSYILVLNKSSKNLSGELDQFKIKKAIFESHLMNYQEGRNVPWGGSSVACSSPCSDREGDCEVYEEGRKQCVSVGCLVTNIETILNENQAFEPSFMEENFDKVSMYSFRDGFLSQTDIGNKYIAYFYGLSSFLSQNVSLILAIRTATLLPRINKMIEKLQLPELYGDQILINNELKVRLMSNLSDYRNLSNNIDYNIILDDIEYDIAQYSNKTVDQILLEIN